MNILTLCRHCCGLVIFCLLCKPSISRSFIQVPFKLVHRLIAIEAIVNNKKGTFILDTGAQRMLLNQKYFNTKSLPSRGNWAGINGTVQSVPYQIIDSFHLQSLTITDLEANFLDLSHIEKKRGIRLLGIIGYEALKNFEVFIDYPARKIQLNPVDKKGFTKLTPVFYEEIQDSLDFKLLHHLIVLKTEVGGVKMRMALDTGSELNLLDRLVKKKVLEHFEARNTINVSGSSSKVVEAVVGMLHHFKLNGQEFPPMRTLLNNLDHMRKSLGIWLDGLLGHEFLRNRRILINYQQRRLYIFKDKAF